MVETILIAFRSLRAIQAPDGLCETIKTMALKAEKLGDFNEASRFIEELVRALQLNGVSSRSLVGSLSRAVRALGLHGEFLATPDYFQTVLWGEDAHQQRVHLAVWRSGKFNLLVSTGKAMKSRTGWPAYLEHEDRGE